MVRQLNETFKYNNILLKVLKRQLSIDSCQDCYFRKRCMSSDYFIYECCYQYLHGVVTTIKFIKI